MNELITVSMDSDLVLTHGFEICPGCDRALVNGETYCGSCIDFIGSFNDVERVDCGIDEYYEPFPTGPMLFVAAAVGLLGVSVLIVIGYVGWRFFSWLG